MPILPVVDVGVGGWLLLFFPESECGVWAPHCFKADYVLKACLSLDRNRLPARFSMLSRDPWNLLRQHR